MDLHMSQAQLAAHAGVSRKWVYEFEAGKPSAELGLILRVLEALGLELEIARTVDAGAVSHRNVDLDVLINQHRD